jgi:hypothetical protein
LLTIQRYYVISGDSMRGYHGIGRRRSLYFYVNITITWQGSLIFALITGLIGLELKEKDDEPPMLDSKIKKDLPLQQ